MCKSVLVGIYVLHLAYVVIVCVVSEYVESLAFSFYFLEVVVVD